MSAQATTKSKLALERQMVERGKTVTPEEMKAAVARLGDAERDAIAKVLAENRSPFRVRRAFVRIALSADERYREALVVCGAARYRALAAELRVKAIEREMVARELATTPAMMRAALARLSAGDRATIAGVVAKHRSPLELRRAFAVGASRVGEEAREALIVLGASNYTELRAELDTRKGAQVRRDEYHAMLRKQKRRGVAEQTLATAIQRVGYDFVLSAARKSHWNRRFADAAIRAESAGEMRAYAAIAAAGKSRAHRVAQTIANTPVFPRPVTGRPCGRVGVGPDRVPVAESPLAGAVGSGR